ncbi:hypothetical protein BC940DRAFT_307829 [Gongronella butleri]|nr:hypothetical protein BC940DRAFT_307829 [Gongronella butleri]
MKSFIVALVACLVSAVAAVPYPNTTYTFQFTGVDAFCMFMPPRYGDSVSGTLDQGVPRCTKASLSNSKRKFPNGFITSAHYLLNDTEHYEQVTGRIDRSKYGLKSTDQGGLYDYTHIKVMCNGDHFFAAFLEPAADRFCIRCCKYSRDCSVSPDAHTCPEAIPGVY